MRLQSSNIISTEKNHIAYLAALSLLFSYAEMLLPRVIPFFRLGLGNVVILAAFDLNPISFLLLNLVRIITNSLLSGTLFTPFVLISLAQGFVSALCMYGLAKLQKKKKLLSIYGISLAGSAISAVVQIFASSLYLGTGTYALLGPMLLFSVLSGLFTAFLVQFFKINESVPVIKVNNPEDVDCEKNIPAIYILIFGSAIFFMLNKSLWLLIPALIFAFAFQLWCHRRIMILPYIGMWLFILICTVFTPNGKVLFKFGALTITQGALIDGLQKALKLSVVSALSQGAASIRFNSDSKSVLNLTMFYFSGLCSVLKSSDGNIIKRLNKALSSEELICNSRDNKKGVSLRKALIIFVVALSLFILSVLCF